MAGNSITTNSSLQCPHGATVQIISTNAQVKADGGFIALQTDQFIISGCPFQIPATPPIPSPCITVQWVVSDTKNKVNQTPTLSKSSVGLCISAMGVPQGQVIVNDTQTKVSTL